MRLITAHKILIAAAVAMFGFLALWQVRRGFLDGNAGSGLLQAAPSAVACAALALYYRRRFP